MTAPRHILALFEPSPDGEAAIRQAVSIAREQGARLTVVTAAVAEPTERKCCDLRSVYWNQVLRELAAEELTQARAAVGLDAGAEFKVVGGRSVATAVADEAARCGADLVLVPRERRLLPWSRTRRVRELRRRAPRSAVVVAPA